MNRSNTQQQQQGDGTREANNNMKNEAVYDFYGKHLVYPKSSLYLFSEKSRVRVAFVKLVAHPWFDRFILLVIALNSIVLALTDWTRIDEDPSSEHVGEPIAEGSWRNTLLYETESMFTAIFTLEFVLKVVSQGFIFGHGAYLRDAWNVLDFVVVVTAVLTSIPGMPTATAIRVFRVLRPLRSLSTLPGLQHLVVSMLKSVPQLVSVLILLQFIFVVFGILGIQLFAGKQHSRCRLTPYPVTTAFETGMDYADHRCLEASNFDVVDEDNSWTQSSSPWSTPQDCWWPLDTDDTRLCAFDDSPGNHQCEHDPAYLNESDFRWCGSDYDALGNRRFEGGVTLEGSPWGGWNLTDNATFVEDLAWGYTTFDNIFVAFLTIFQSITLEGWSDILYQVVVDCVCVCVLFFVLFQGHCRRRRCLVLLVLLLLTRRRAWSLGGCGAFFRWQVKDCSRPVLADLFFIVLVLWGAFFTLNLLLAVLENNFSQGGEEDEARQAAAAEQRQQEQQADSSIDDVLGVSVEEKAIAAEREVEDGEAGVKAAAAAAADGLAATEEGRRTGGGEGAAWGLGVEGGTREELLSDRCHSISSSGSGGSETEGYRDWRVILWRLTASDAFLRSITTLIILNTLTLALDHHPMDDDFSTVLDLLNLVFTLCFALEMALKLVALGPRGYAKDKFNLFDGLVVLSSLVELAIWPPNILTGGEGEDWGGGLSALRSFRVLRILKLARGWSSMRDLLETLRKTLLDIGNFALLLLLFMFIYVLIGVQFFANRLHFAEDGRVIGIGEEGYYDAKVPRSNFDTLLHAFTTVFEVLSGENWNATMYSARRAVGWVSVIYFVSLIVVGMMIVMSLFLAILLSHFATPEQDEAVAEDRERRQEKEKLERQQQQQQQSLTGATPAKHEEGKNGVGMKGEEEEEEEEEDVAARKEGAERNGADGGNKGPRTQGWYTSELDESFRGANSFFDSDSPGTAAQRALWRAHRAASTAPFGSVGTRGVPHATGEIEEEREEEEEHAHQHHLTNSNNNSDAEVAGSWDTNESPDNGSDEVDADANSGDPGSERKENAGCFSLSRLGASVAGYAAGAVRSVKVPENIYPGFALCCLSAKNPWRRGCAAVVSNAGFSRLVTLLIVLSSLTLALDSPLRDPDSTAAEALGTLELALTFLFVLEGVLKVCASGFYFMPLAYLRDAWNVLDFGVVMVSVVQLFLVRGAGLSGLRSLRALRALRPLRIVKRFPGLKLVLEALIGSVQGVFNVAAVCFLFYIIFAILCVNYFKGLLMSCQGDAFDALPGEVVSFLEDPLPWSDMSSGQREWFGPLSNVSEAFSGDGFSSSIGGNLSTSGVEYCDVITGGLWPDAAGCCSAWPTSAEEAPTSYEVCECLGLSWAETIPQQFDNVAVSLLTLFEISTTEAWTSVTYAAVDASGVGMQPIRDHVMARVWLFILFMLLGAYLVMNLFVGVIVDNFKKMKARAEEGGLLVTGHQRLWIKTQLIMRRLRPMKRIQPPPDRLGSLCFRLINFPWFDSAVMVCIVLNTVVLAMKYFGQSNLYTRYRSAQ
ncbi:unnamed protein product [Ectocarpus sp. CCAP 1310/34]|nr:unnamed protein product [Ectocarpus sp. CCAP 1310/34]